MRTIDLLRMLDKPEVVENLIRRSLEATLLELLAEHGPEIRRRSMQRLFAEMFAASNEHTASRRERAGDADVALACRRHAQLLRTGVLEPWWGFSEDLDNVLAETEGASDALCRAEVIPAEEVRHGRTAA